MTMMSIYEWKQQVEFELSLQCSAMWNVWQKYSRRIQMYIPKKNFQPTQLVRQIQILSIYQNPFACRLISYAHVQRTAKFPKKIFNFT